MKASKFISRSLTCSATHQSNNTVSIDAIRKLHAYLLVTKQHTHPHSICDVIRFYAASPATLHKALHAFSQTENPNLYTYNIVIRALSTSDQPIDALHMFDEMRKQGYRGNHFTFVSVFKACSRVLNLDNLVSGMKVHGHVMKLGCESYLYVSNALVHMYALCSELDYARKVFDEMLERDTVSWNSLICGYTQCKRFKDVIRLFNAMREANVEPDALTMAKVLLASSKLRDVKLTGSMVKYIEDTGMKIDLYLGNTLMDVHGRDGEVELAQKVFDQMEEKNTVSWNTLITGYAKAKDLVAAKKLFDKMPKRDVISWSAMIAGYSQNKQFIEAVRLFQEMTEANVKPDEITMTSVVSASARIGNLDLGIAVHDSILQHNLIEDLFVGNSLVDMYCKCGSVEKALKVFGDMREIDSISWTIIITGLAVNGYGNDALQLFSRMVKDGFAPTNTTFIGVLLACTHAGLVDKGLDYFEMMKKDYGLKPDMKLYGCVVDLLSRSGDLDRAYEFMNQMPVEPDVVLWRILLSSCKLHKNVKFAEIATKKLLELDPGNSGNYILSSNMYAGSDRWDDASKLRELMEDNTIHKGTGWSSLETNGEIPHT